MTAATEQRQTPEIAMDTAIIERADAPMPSYSNTVVTPMTMIDRALASNAAPDTLERLLALQERWEANEARKAFDAAMAEAKAEIPTIIKNREVDFTSQKGRTHYRHEDLAEIARTVDPILGRHGLSYRFRTTSEPNQPVIVTCIVSHRLGHSEQNTLMAGRDDSGNKNSIQQVGSTITYLQRYTLKAALGLAASQDDDGASVGKSQDEIETISEDQAKVIRDLIEETNTDIVKFCTYLKVEAVPDITVAQFKRAVDMLEKKRGAR